MIEATSAPRLGLPDRRVITSSELAMRRFPLCPASPGVARRRTFVTLAVLTASALCSVAPTAVDAAEPRGFANPIAMGADPWVTRHDGAYFWCRSDGDDGVAVWRSERLTEPGERHVVWRAAAGGPHSDEVWAPELHHIDGRWYVYVAASDGENKNHRTIVLESPGDDPLAEFALKAELYTGDSIETGRDNRWAIDATVLSHGGKRYFVWSGWAGDEDEQWLYAAPMSNPWTAGANRVRLCDNDDYLWERVSESPRERGLNEAPQPLARDGRLFLVYSCSGGWESTYKLGMLTLDAGGDPLCPADWAKGSEPVFRSSRETFGVGHCSFVSSPDGTEDWLLFHAKVDREPGWRREIFAQPFGWAADGSPRFGEPVSRGRQLAAPSGQVEASAGSRQ